MPTRHSLAPLADVPDGQLIPYSMSDDATSFATVPLADVLATLTPL